MKVLINCPQLMHRYSHPAQVCVCIWVRMGRRCMCILAGFLVYSHVCVFVCGLILVFDLSGRKACM